MNETRYAVVIGPIIGILLIAMTIVLIWFENTQREEKLNEVIIGDNNCLLNQDNRFDQQICMANKLIELENRIEQLEHD